MSNNFINCLIGNEWYECPISIAVFCLFVMLFIYSLYICSHNWALIVKYSHPSTISDTIEKIHDPELLQKLEKLYIMNLIACFVCFGVITFFIAKAVPLTHFMAVFNETIAILLVIFLIIVSSWNISVYNSKSLQSDSHNAIQSINGTVLSISIIIVLGSIGYIYFTKYHKQ